MAAGGRASRAPGPGGAARAPAGFRRGPPRLPGPHPSRRPSRRWDGFPRAGAPRGVRTQWGRLPWAGPGRGALRGSLRAPLRRSGCSPGGSLPTCRDRAAERRRAPRGTSPRSLRGGRGAAEARMTRQDPAGARGAGTEPREAASGRTPQGLPVPPGAGCGEGRWAVGLLSSGPRACPPGHAGVRGG